MRIIDAHFAVFPVNGKRDSSKFCGMFMVADSDRVIDDQPTRPYSMTKVKWKEKGRWDGILE